MAARRFRPPNPLVFAVLGVLCGAVFGFLAVTSWQEARALDARGQEATGTVTSVRERFWPRGPSLRVEFATADGRQARTFVIVDRGSDATVGEEVRIRYDPRDPDNAARAGSGGPNYWMYALVCALFVLGAPAVAWFVIRPVRRTLANRPDLAERVARVEG